MVFDLYTNLSNSNVVELQGLGNCFTETEVQIRVFGFQTDNMIYEQSVLSSRTGLYIN